MSINLLVDFCPNATLFVSRQNKHQMSNESNANGIISERSKISILVSN